MNKNIINKNNLGAILLLNEINNIKVMGLFYQVEPSNNSITLVTNDANKKIILPVINCVNSFDHSDLIDNSYYEEIVNNNDFKTYTLEQLNGVYTDGIGWYVDNYVVAPFIKNMNK